MIPSHLPGPAVHPFFLCILLTLYQHNKKIQEGEGGSRHSYRSEEIKVSFLKADMPMVDNGELGFLLNCMGEFSKVY